MAHNKLNTTFRILWQTNTNFIDEIDMSENQMYGIIPLDIGVLPSLRTVNLTGNNFSYGKNGNPFLPNTLVPDYTVLTANATGRFSCPRITALTYPVNVYLDSSYYNFQLCVCDYGTRRVNNSGSYDYLECVECPEHLTCFSGDDHETHFIFSPNYYPTPSVEDPEQMVLCESSVCNPDGGSTFECPEGMYFFHHLFFFYFGNPFETAGGFVHSLTLS
eukprot:TRINITY_DN839_c0_g1_i19.p1 TRINITY_DN839_c0_g1~~TRINITY_DN839_c0_g1_i19.p1  ORF type:complete len:218 (-),score=27.83 TRINITY_DN839_c0_g1_i19:561-1214(-)